MTVVIVGCSSSISVVDADSPPDTVVDFWQLTPFEQARELCELARQNDPWPEAVAVITALELLQGRTGAGEDSGGSGPSSYCRESF